MARTLPTPPHPPRLDDLTPVDLLDNGGVDADPYDLDAARVAASGGEFDVVEVRSCRLRSGTLAGSSWRRTSWADVELVGVDAANVSAVEGIFHRVAWTQSRLTGVSMPGATLQDVRFTGCVLDLASLRFSRLTRVVFDSCRMVGADLAGARLIDVRFERCDLGEAQFHEARHTRTLLDSCELLGLKGVEGLRGATVTTDRMADLAEQLASAMGIRLIDPTEA